MIEDLAEALADGWGDEEFFGWPEQQPRLCTPELIEDNYGCPRCWVLGRLGDKPVAR
jgi:hypothetical protein